MTKKKKVQIRVSSLKKSDYRHEPFGPAYQPFFEKLATAFGEFMPGDGGEAGWEDDFRRDAHPEVEMDFWNKLLHCYEHFTASKNLAPETRKDIFRVLFGTLGQQPGGPPTPHLTEQQVKELKDYVRETTQGKSWPIIVE